MSYLFESADDYALSKDVDVALWLDCRAFEKKEPLRDAVDLVIVNTCLHDEFDKFKRDEIKSGYSYLRLNELLLHYISQCCSHLRQHIVARYGLNYLKLDGIQIDHLCRWVKEKRDCIGQDGLGIHSLRIVSISTATCMLHARVVYLIEISCLSASEFKTPPSPELTIPPPAAPGSRTTIPPPAAPGSGSTTPPPATPGSGSTTPPPAAPGSESTTPPPAAPGSGSTIPPPAAPGSGSGSQSTIPPPAAPSSELTTPLPTTLSSQSTTHPTKKGININHPVNHEVA